MRVQRGYLLTCDDKTGPVALVLGHGRKRLQRQPDILLPLESVDAQDHLLSLEQPLTGLAATVLLLPQIHAGVHDPHLDFILEAGPRRSRHAPGELAVDRHALREAHAPFLESVEGHAVQALDPGAPAGKQQVREVAVEEDGGAGQQVAQEGQARGELVDDDGRGLQAGELAGEGEQEEELDVAEDGAEDREAVEDGHGDGPGGADADVEGAFFDIKHRLAKDGVLLNGRHWS